MGSLETIRAVAKGESGDGLAIAELDSLRHVILWYEEVSYR